MRIILLALLFITATTSFAAAQPGILTREQLIEYTPDWKGERFADGRPKVSDAILDRMKRVTLGHERLRARVYSAGQIDGRWTEAIEADFTAWLRQNIDRLPVARAQIEEILKQR
jgi:hypothetical protein